MCDSDEEEIKLCAETQAILNSFLKERDEENGSQEISENWQLSQFWYDSNTQKVFGKICKKLIQESEFKHDFSIALLSCPSLYETFYAICDNLKLFEFDERFSKYKKNFVHYDYNLGDNDEYLKEHKNTFDLIIFDPPFLSDDCLRKSKIIVDRLAKESSTKIILNTGSVQRELANELGLIESSYKPQHKNNLGNEFSCYSNFDLNKYL